MKKNILLGILIFMGVIALGIGASYGFGWIGVHQTKTIRKAQKDAEREVFENTQSYVEGKRQEATKFYREYQQAESTEDKQAIRIYVSNSFANFDENKLQSPLKEFIYNCKFNL